MQPFLSYAATTSMHTYLASSTSSFMLTKAKRWVINFQFVTPKFVCACPALSTCVMQCPPVISREMMWVPGSCKRKRSVWFVLLNSGHTPGWPTRSWAGHAGYGRNLSRRPLIRVFWMLVSKVTKQSKAWTSHEQLLFLSIALHTLHKQIDDRFCTFTTMLSITIRYYFPVSNFLPGWFCLIKHKLKQECSHAAPLHHKGNNRGEKGGGMERRKREIEGITGFRNELMLGNLPKMNAAK